MIPVLSLKSPIPPRVAYFFFQRLCIFANNSGAEAALLNQETLMNWVDATH